MVSVGLFNFCISGTPCDVSLSDGISTTTAANAKNPSSSFNSNPNGNAGDSNYSSEPPRSWHRGGIVRPSYPKNEREILGPELFDVPQLVHEIQDKLARRAVDCVICYDMIGSSARIWSCSRCYSIFHLSSIKRCARASTCVDFFAQKNQGVDWRCPGCRCVQLLTAEEIRYVCFCGKRPDPRRDFNLTRIHAESHVGSHCRRRLQVVPIATMMIGAPMSVSCSATQVRVVSVKAFAPCRPCPCGQTTLTTRCSDRKCMFTCEKPCNKLLECGLHRGERICYHGLCNPRQVLTTIFCFCKKEVKFLVCRVFVNGAVRQSDGVFSCNSTCRLKLSCGHHTYHETCHPGPCGDCKLRWRINSCYCGKTKIQKERLSCMYSIPTCSQICGKLLPCGIHNHLCKELCHSGNCPPCLVCVNQKCLRGSSSWTVDCYRTMDLKFVCDTAFGQKKKVPLQLQPVEATGKKVPIGHRKLTSEIWLSTWFIVA